tara:strand:- start:205 stop:540 length:336 start_codon:yes stop_codon:yes gene_type:complete
VEDNLKPVIKNFKDFSNPVLGGEDGVPTVVSLYHDHEPGEMSPHHEHDWEHQAFITRGSGILWVDGAEYPIATGDFVLVPPNSSHYFKNTGSTTLSRVTFNPIRSESHLTS